MPSILFEIPNLETVILSNNQIAEFRSLPNQSIKHLDLSHNQITDFLFIEPLPNLETLNLAHNELTGILNLSNQYPSFIVLKKLNLSHNHIKDIYDVYSCGNLESLDLSSNELSEWNSELPTTLNTLNLSDNEIYEPRFIGENIDFSNLRELNLSNNEIRKFYRDLPFQNIEHLILRGNYLNDFAVFSAYKNLEYLDLEGCQMGRYLVKINENFEKLKYLDLSNNQIFTLDMDNNQLEELNISLNNIHHLHEINIINALNLRTLNISRINFSEQFNMEYIRKFNQPKLERIIALNLTFQDANFRNRFEAAINPNTEIIYE